MSLLRWLLFGLSTYCILTLASVASPASMAATKASALLLGVKLWWYKILRGDT